jgi:competence protein ComEC
VPHHGSKTSSLPEFLESVQPRWAVIQAGYQNHYGHPAAIVTRRYHERNIPLTSTMACGAWHWRSSQAPHQGRCERQIQRRYWHAQEGALVNEDVSGSDSSVSGGMPGR